MKFNVALNSAGKPAGCLVVGVFEDRHLMLQTTHLDKINHGRIRQFLQKATDFQGKIGQSLFFYDFPKTPLLLIGCGKKSTTSTSVRDFRKIIKASTQCLLSAQITRATNYLTELAVAGQTLANKIKQAVEASEEALYVFDQYKSKPAKKPPLKEISFSIDNKTQLAACQQALKNGTAVAAGVTLTKNLANLPPNVCTPQYLANQAQQLKKSYKKLSVKVLNKTAMKKLGMGAFLAVTAGSAREPALVCITYQGGSAKQRPVALVGKGITFDTGGINLKSSDSMVGMKYDMCGAATVLGVIKTIAELKLPINVVGLMACAENMPSGTASRPEDIVRSLSGQTIEIMNTDAEGRLVLCDTLTYAERFNPDVVIDIATLTGAVVIALGYHASGLVSNDEKLAADLLRAGNECYDRAWQLPLWDEYQEQIKSPFADISNVGGRGAGTITAGCFLSRFATKFNWAHLDVAGTAAIMGGGERMATGRPVPLLTQYLIDRCKKK